MGHERNEAKTATHDGWIWPVPRHEMRIHECIRQRMVEDLRRLKAEAGEEPVNLCEAGWTEHQVAIHGLAAKNRLERSERDEAHRTAPSAQGFARVQRFATGAAEIASLAMFFGAVAIWAAHFTGNL